MARQRKRFYVGIPNGYGPSRVLSLKHTPTEALYGFLFRDVVGPFRTSAAAQRAKRSGRAILGVPVRELERVVTGPRRVAA